MDDPAAGEDHPGTPELKRTYLSLLAHGDLVDLVLGLDSRNIPSAFPSDLRAEVRRMQAAADADGEGSPDPQPAPRPTSVPPGGPRTRAGAARAYAAALASMDRPEPPFPQFPAVSPEPSTPVSPGSPVAWHSPPRDSVGPVRTPAKKTRTGVIGGYNPITSIGPSSEGLPSYEEMIVLALMESPDNEGVAPKDVFAWMSARWPLNANFRPSASQALQKAYKRGRLEKVGTKYKLNPNWHGGATTNRTTRRPQSMAEVPGNYAWAPPPVPPVITLPPDPRVRNSQPPASTPGSAPPQQPTPQSQPVHGEFDAQAQVASLLKALQEAGPSDPNPNGTSQDQQGSSTGGPQLHLPHAVSLASVPAPAPAPAPAPGHASPVTAISPAIPTSVQHPMPSAPVTQNGMLPLPLQNGMPPPPPIQNVLPPQPQNPVAAHPMPPGHPVPMTYSAYHPAPTALQASLATLASQLANMSKTNQGA